jgi:hypothetical protein
VSDIALELVDSLKVLDPDGRLEKRTHAPQQKVSLFDHFVGGGLAQAGESDRKIEQTPLRGANTSTLRDRSIPLQTT